MPTCGAAHAGRLVGAAHGDAPARRTDGRELLAALLEAERPSVAGAGEFRDDVLLVLDRWDKQHLVDEVLSQWHDIDLDDDVACGVALLSTSSTKLLACPTYPVPQDVVAEFTSPGHRRPLRLEQRGQ